MELIFKVEDDALVSEAPEATGASGLVSGAEFIVFRTDRKIILKRSGSVVGHRELSEIMGEVDKAVEKSARSAEIAKPCSVYPRAPRDFKKS